MLKLGGSGSGQWHRLNKKTIADRCHSLDINEISKASKLKEGYAGTITWTSFMGKEMGILSIKIVHQSVELGYAVNLWDDPKSIKYIVHLTFSLCNYGGRRPWFACPRCRKRVGKLYLNGKYFLCRHCHNLAYACQSEDSSLRLMRKAKKIRERLDCSRDLREPILFKPKGMHQRTFDRLWHQEMTTMSRFNGVAMSEIDLLSVRSANAMAVLNSLKKTSGI